MSENDETTFESARLLDSLREVRAMLEATQAELSEARGAQDSLASEGERLRRQAMTFEARRAKDVQAHEAALAKVRARADADVVQTALRAEAARLGAYNPDDVLRIVDFSSVHRIEDGSVVGIAASMEQARAERGYLFAEPPISGAVSGNTVGSAAPKPGDAPCFDARAAPVADYEARKWQFLRGNS